MQDIHANPLRRLVLLLGLALLIGCGTRSSEEPPAITPSPGQTRDTPARIEPRSSDDPPPKTEEKGSVAGLVIVDGQPLINGTITFIPAAEGSKLLTMAASIKDGKYNVEKVPMGSYKVSISSPHVVGKKKVYDKADSPSADLTVESLPARYNEKTLLSATVKEGANKLDFELTSK